MVEDVGFDILPIPAPLQEENVGASGIHTQEFGIFTGIEMSVSTDETVIMGEHMCTRMDKVLAVNFDPFGACACCNGSPCTAPVIDWTHVTDKIRLGGNLLLLENSELLCSLGGRIRIFYTLAAASAACGASREEERSFWSKAIDFGKGLGKGLWKGLKGTVTGVIDLGIWAGKHSLPYMLLDPAGFADQLKQDGEILKSLGNLAGKAGTWMYRNSAVNLLANPQDFLAAQQENRAMLETLADKAANMSAEEWGDFAGQVLFEVGTEVATAGGAAALTAVKVADKVVDVAKVANRVDDVLDAAKALDKLDDAADIAKAADKLDDAADAAKALDKAKVPKLEPPVKNIDEFLFDYKKYRLREGEKLGDFGETIAKDYYRSLGYDEFYAVQNKSGNGVDIVARNSQTGDMVKAEVKTTQQDKLWNGGKTKEIPLSKDQRQMGGEHYTNDRLNRAAKRDDGYTDGRSSEQAKEAIRMQEEAELKGAEVKTEKIDIYVNKEGTLRGNPKVRKW